MKIGIMLRHYDQHGGGVKVCTHKLVREVVGVKSPHKLVLAYGDSTRVGTYRNGNHVREVAIETPKLLPSNPLLMMRADDFLWDQFAMPKVERKENLDLIFNPKYSVPLVKATLILKMPVDTTPPGTATESKLRRAPSQDSSESN